MLLQPIDYRGQQVAPRQVLLAAGLTPFRLRNAVVAGRWQEPLPGVLVSHTGGLSRRERWQAALYYGGEGAVLSHRSALIAWGARIEEARSAGRVAGVRGNFRRGDEHGIVELTVPHGRHLRSVNFVVVHQSRRPVEQGWIIDRLAVAPPARAAIDVAISSSRRSDVDHVIAEVLQRNLCSVTALEEEASLLARRLNPWLVAAIGDARRGMRSVGESDLRRALEMAGVPEPEWGAAIETPTGTYFVDALWRKQRVAAEADGALFHVSARDWSYDLRRQNSIQGVGVTLFRYPVRRLRAEPLACGLEILERVA